MGKIYEALEKSVSDTAQGGDEGLWRRGAQEAPAYGPFDQDLVVLGSPASPIAEQFRTLRSRICRPLRGDNPRTVLITSAFQGAGKSFIAVNLAATIAQGLDEHVLLVDADLRKPRLHEIFNLPNSDKGLAHHLQDNLPLTELLHKPGIGKLSVLPAGLDVANPAELLSSSRMKRFIIEVRHRYPDRYVIFDAPPIEMAPELSIIANEVEGVYLVVRQAYTPREAAKSSLEKIASEKFMGIIFNGYNKTSKYYKKYSSKYDKYHYGYGYNYQKNNDNK